MVKYFPHNTLHFSHSTTECWMSGTGPQLLELVWITLLKCDADLHNHLCTHVSDVWRLLEVMPLASNTPTINHIFVLKETAFFFLTNGYFLTWFKISKLQPMDATFVQLSQFQISAIFNCNLAKVVVLKRCQTLFTCLVSSQSPAASGQTNQITWFQLDSVAVTGSFVSLPSSLISPASHSPAPHHTPPAVRALSNNSIAIMYLDSGIIYPNPCTHFTMLWEMRLWCSQDVVTNIQCTKEYQAQHLFHLQNSFTGRMIS